MMLRSNCKRQLRRGAATAELAILLPFLAFLFVIGLALSLAGLPLDWYAQFRLEERFGFNTTTQKLWWLDRIKGLLLALALGYPLLVLVLKLVQWMGQWWWLWTWAAVLAFELLMVVLAPILIMPLFNEFTPLPPGSLRERLLALAGRVGFGAKEIQIIDGSKRSRHSNAFFTGFGRFRKIVLFDTLIQQLAEPALSEGVLHGFRVGGLIDCATKGFRHGVRMSEHVELVEPPDP